MSVAAEVLHSERTLPALLAGIADAPAIPLTGIATDSRRVEPGYLFLACQGLTSHGLDFVGQAAERGAVAVVWDTTTGSAPDTTLPAVGVKNLAGHIGEIANRWFGHPSRTVRVCGVTGTNGKTTVAWLARQALELLGEPCAYIGTLGSVFGDEQDTSVMTTPACVELNETLARYRDRGAEHAAIEVSSHALDQSRVDGLQFDSAIFTNLSRDHIDYHGSMRAYFEAKAALFLDYDVKNRIVSLDTDFGTELADRCGGAVVTVSTRFDRVANGRPFVFVRGIVHKASGSQVSVTTAWGDAEFTLPMPGDFNVANAASVLALLLCRGVAIDAAADVLGRLAAPPGRMERVPASGAGQPAVFVDYSHTPASLEAALKALRGHCRGRIWCVFGCGGDRDRGKRPMMGKVAARLSDVPVVTSDNPRTEDPQAIIDDVLEGMSGETVSFVDREEAIAYAVSRAAEADCVLVAGKGHEDYQVIGESRLPFSDTRAAARHLAARGDAADA